MRHHLVTRPPRSRAAVALAVLGLGCGIHVAHAQGLNNGVSIGPSQALEPPSANMPGPSAHIFGDWGGLRTRLDRAGIDFSLDYIAEVAGNPSGGVKQGATYAGQIGFEADGDWNRIAGIPGLTTHVVLVNRQGSTDSTLFGDNLNPTQEIYGAGGNVGVHLVYAYAEESLANGRVDIAGGRMPLLNDFAASPLNCNFMNNALCGNPKLLPSADIGISSYPDAVWAGRIRVRPTADTYIQTGAYEVSQGLYNYKYIRSGFDFGKLSTQDSGAEIPVEVAYEPQVGPDKLPGHYKLGFAYDTSTNNKYYTDQAQFLNGVRSTGSKTEYWALADQMVFRTGPGPTNGLIVLAGYTHADPNLSNYSDQIFAAALYQDFWKARPDDTIGFLFNYTSISGALGKEQALDEEFGLPIAGGATGIQTHAENIEINYDIAVAPGVNFAPDFQYFFRPNAVGNIKDALVFGFKSHLNF